jgi:hypothetical protein
MRWIYAIWHICHKGQESIEYQPRRSSSIMIAINLPSAASILAWSSPSTSASKPAWVSRSSTARLELKPIDPLALLPAGVPIPRPGRRADPRSPMEGAARPLLRGARPLQRPWGQEADHASSCRGWDQGRRTPRRPPQAPTATDSKTAAQARPQPEPPHQDHRRRPEPPSHAANLTAAADDHHPSQAAAVALERLATQILPNFKALEFFAGKLLCPPRVSIVQTPLSPRESSSEIFSIFGDPRVRPGLLG